MTTKTKAAVTKGERSRQKIVETAAVLFNQKGFTGCSMGDIVAASGLEKGTLYGHFSTKEELALLAFDYAWKDTSDKRLRNIDTVSNAVDKLKLHVDNYVNTPSFPGGCPLLNFAVDADDGNLALRTRVRKALRGWEDFLAKIVGDGQSAGEINPEVEPRFGRQPCDLHPRRSNCISTDRQAVLCSRRRSETPQSVPGDCGQTQN